jgi:ABC-type proline/glycine betaine transport system substrate-binding protein
VVEMLEKMTVGLEPLNDTLGWTVKNEVQDWEKAAIYYLQNYEDRWKTWVTPEAYERIKEALEEVHS